MDLVKLRAIVVELDREVPADGGVVRIEQYGGGPDESSLTGNQIGLFRLGIELLRAGLAEQPNTRDEIVRGRESYRRLRSLFHPKSEVQIDSIGRDDLAQRERFSMAWFGNILGNIALLGCMGLAAYGLYRLIHR